MPRPAAVAKRSTSRATSAVALKRGRPAAGSSSRRPILVNVLPDDGKPRQVGALSAFGIAHFWRVALLMPREHVDLSQPLVDYSRIKSGQRVCVGGVVVSATPPAHGHQELDDDAGVEVIDVAETDEDGPGDDDGRDGADPGAAASTGDAFAQEDCAQVDGDGADDGGPDAEAEAEADADADPDASGAGDSEVAELQEVLVAPTRQSLTWELVLHDIGEPAQRMRVSVAPTTTTHRAQLQGLVAGATLWVTGTASCDEHGAIIDRACLVDPQDFGQIVASYPSRATRGQQRRKKRVGGTLRVQRLWVLTRVSASVTADLMRKKLPYSIPRCATAIRRRLELFEPASEWKLLRQLGSQMPTLEALLRSLHHPLSAQQAQCAGLALKRIAAIDVLRQASAQRSASPAKSHALTLRLSALRDGLRHVRQTLGFELTSEQALAVAEIVTDLRSPKRTHRMLSGDVGSGKTVVFSLVAYMLARVGELVVVLEPRTGLANEIHRRLSTTFPDVPVQLVLADSPLDLDFAHGIVVGTVAIWSRLERLARPPALIVADEQHKLGTEQRQPWDHTLANVLEATATPIPRTLALMTLAGMPVTRLPAGRVAKSILTRSVVGPDEAQTVYTEAMERMAQTGANLIVVYPFIDAPPRAHALRALQSQAKLAGRVGSRSTAIDHAAGSTEADRLEDRIEALRDVHHSVEEGIDWWGRNLGAKAIDHVHGRRPNYTRVIDRFAAGEFKVLIATTVVEIGIDLPRADMMIIHCPERMGISAVHQLRGRLARKGGTAWCYLVSGKEVTAESLAMMELMETETDGLRLAEADLKRRGGGDLAMHAREQSGELQGILVGQAVQSAEIAWVRANCPEWLGQDEVLALAPAPPDADVVAALQRVVSRQAGCDTAEDLPASGRTDRRQTRAHAVAACDVQAQAHSAASGPTAAPQPPTPAAALQQHSLFD